MFRPGKGGNDNVRVFGCHRSTSYGNRIEVSQPGSTTMSSSSRTQGILSQSSDTSQENTLILKRQVSLHEDSGKRRRILSTKRPSGSMKTWPSMTAVDERRQSHCHHVEPAMESDVMVVEDSSKGNHYSTLALHQQILDQFAQGSKRLLREDRHWIDDHHVDEILREDVDHQREWLDLVLHARHRAQAWDATQYTTERNVLHNWLRPGS